MSPVIPEKPTKLPGELWGITSFFNPARYKNKPLHLKRFSEGVRSQGLKLLVVELAFGESPFEVTRDLCDRLVRRRTKSVLWHKERLLNIGLQYLPPSCDKVVWLDADIQFENRGWVKETSRLLESFVVVQPFDTAFWLGKGMRSISGGDFGHGNREGQCLPGMVYALSQRSDRRVALSRYSEHGHTGFAWAARRSLLMKHGLYDRQILGNGDFVMAHAMYGDEDFWNGRNPACRRLSPQILDHITEWSRKFYRDVGASVGYVPGPVLHTWHGSYEARQYEVRLEVLKANDFDPNVDIRKDVNGCWTWNGEKPELHHWAFEYFFSRKEE